MEHDLEVGVGKVRRRDWKLPGRSGTTAQAQTRKGEDLDHIRTEGKDRTRKEEWLGPGVGEKEEGKTRCSVWLTEE